MSLGTIAKLGVQVARSHLGQTAPLEVGWDYTYRCNARCAYCTNWSTDYPVMPLPQARELIDRVRRLGAFQMSLGGGEPLTRGDLPEIVSAIKKAGMRAAITTNGTILSAEIYRALFSAGLDSLTFSLDGATKESHERFRHGCSFDRLLRAIRLCQGLRRDEGHRVRLSTNTVLTNKTVREIPQIAALVRSLGIEDFHFQPVWRQHYTTAHLGHRIGGDFDEVYGFTGENDALLEEAMELIAAAGSSNDPDYTALFADFYRGTARARSLTCFAGRAFLFIDADGNVRPCGTVPETFGNLLEDRYAEDPALLFRGPGPAQIKEDAAAQRCGGCASVCYMERNILMGALVRPDKLLRVVRKRVLRR
jgi:AdoMet-dependent heme synthase